MTAAPSFRDWLHAVTATGESVQAAPPTLTAAERPHVLAGLRANYARHALEVAGPPLAFDADAGLWAATVVADACWRLVGGAEKIAPLESREPPTPAAHLSADAMLRFLPMIFRRAKGRDADDPLVPELDALSRRWPLCGVLLDLDGVPTTPPTFGGHAGLQLLYAERFVECPRPGWLPPAGPGREWVERICAERGRPLPQAPEDVRD